MNKYLIGYVDEQEGERIDFANLMGDVEEHEDNIFEVYFFPVDRETSFEELMEDILGSGIHCLVVDYQLSETGVQFEGGRIINELFRRRPYFPSIIYTAKEKLVIQQVENEILYKIQDKSIKSDVDQAANFRRKIKALIDSYFERIEKFEKELKRLNKKKTNGKLTEIEEREYLKLNYEVEKLFGDGRETDAALYSEETNKRLDTLIEMTEKLLTELSKE